MRRFYFRLSREERELAAAEAKPRNVEIWKPRTQEIEMSVGDEKEQRFYFLPCRGEEEERHYQLPPPQRERAEAA